VRHKLETMQHLNPHLLIGAVVAGISATATFGGSVPCVRYVVEVIQGPYCGFGLYPVTQGHGVSGGTVVGYYSTCISLVDRAFVAAPGQAMVTLPMIPGTVDMQAEDINGVSQVVGWAKTGAGEYLAFLRSGGVTTVLQTPAGFAGSKAWSLNDAGIIVGESYEPDAPEATVWVGGEPMQILPDVSASRAADISESNQVVGWMGAVPTFQSDAFVLDLDTGELTNLGHLPDGTGAATAINECGEIVGYGIAELPDRSTITRAIVWTGGSMQVLEPLPGFKRSAANDINDGGVVVGQCWDTAASMNASTAFVWRDGVMRDLNELLLPGSGLDMRVARAIDSEGRITGYAADSRNDVVAVRLTPVKPALGDLDCDGSVNASDLAILLGGWNLPGAGDLDRDGAVGPPDLAILLGAWTS
jgi:probable HAF family extracellular repeat protein